jgi:hypothetical protein
MKWQLGRQLHGAEVNLPQRPPGWSQTLHGYSQDPAGFKEAPPGGVCGHRTRGNTRFG